jgi:hypothetical protein
MSKTYLILFSLCLLTLKVGFAETISSSTNTGKEKDQYNTVTSHQQGAPAKVVKPSTNINPIIVVPVTPNSPRTSTTTSK